MVYFLHLVLFIITLMLVRLQCNISQGIFLSLVSAVFSLSSNCKFSHTNSVTTFNHNFATFITTSPFQPFVQHDFTLISFYQFIILITNCIYLNFDFYCALGLSTSLHLWRLQHYPLPLNNWALVYMIKT